jgi:hypothetical protein
MLRDRPGSQVLEQEYPFWDHPRDWPHDPPGYVFLARACQEVGRAMFGSKWAESWGEPDEPPDDCDLATWEEYKRECDEFQNAFVAMRAEVVQSIGEQCEIGTLVAAVRPKAGGKMITLKQYMWNAEGVEPRFHRCDMSLDDAFESSGGFCRPYWIFIGRASLDGLLSQLHQRASLPNATAAAPETSPSTNGFNGRRDHRRLAAQKALLDIYGPDSSGLGDIEDVCLRKVNEWLVNHGKLPVSKATLKRAKHELRPETQPERN